MDPTLRQIADYGLALVALLLVSGFLAWLVKWVIEDLRKQRDRAMDSWSAQVAATEKLATATEKLTDLVSGLATLIRDRRVR